MNRYEAQHSSSVAGRNSAPSANHLHLRPAHRVGRPPVPHDHRGHRGDQQPEEHRQQGDTDQPTMVSQPGSVYGCGTSWNGGGYGAGSPAATTANSSGTATSPSTTHRHRGPSSRPSGKKSISSAAGT